MVEDIPRITSHKNLWHELEDCLRREIKPKAKHKLINGIVEFLGFSVW